MSKKILFVITGADMWTLNDGTKQPTGFWAEEALGPYSIFKDAGYEIIVATPNGVIPTVDAMSLTPDFNGGEDGAKAQRAKYETASELHNPISLEDVNADDFEAVFYPGGWGPMEDLPTNAASGKVIRDFYDAGKITSFVCHGPCALFATIDETGNSPYDGYTMTGLSNAEEIQNGLADKAPWLLQDRLISDLHAQYQEAPAFTEHVVEDRNLITGQNPVSSVALARAVLKRLS